MIASIMLIVISTINIQLQGQFVSISLRLFLRIVAAYVVSTVLPSCSEILPPGGVSLSTRQLTGYSSEYYL